MNSVRKSVLRLCMFACAIMLICQVFYYQSYHFLNIRISRTLLSSQWNVSSKYNHSTQIYFLQAYLDQRQLVTVENGYSLITLLGLRLSSALLPLEVECLKITSYDNIIFNLDQLAQEHSYYDKGAVNDNQYSSRVWRCGPTSLPMFTRNGTIHVRVSFIQNTMHSKFYSDISLPFTIIPPIKYHQPKYNFTLCLSPTFGHISHHRFIEFIEMNRVLGVQHLYIYNYNSMQLNPLVNETLNYYSGKDGDHFISITQWTLPATVTMSNVYYVGQFLAVQHCLHESMLQSKYTLFYDLDELIIPHGVNEDGRKIVGLNDFVDSIHFNDPQSTICGICFPMHFFLFEGGRIIQKDVDSVSHPNISRVAYLRNLDRMFGHPFNHKCLVRSMYVTGMGVHQVYSCLPGYHEEYYQSDVAIIQHYYETFCLNPRNTDSSWCQFESRDETILLYANEFQMRIASLPHYLTSAMSLI